MDVARSAPQGAYYHADTAVGAVVVVVVVVV